MCLQRLRFQDRLFWLALAGGLPATLLCTALLWRALPAVELRVVSCAMLLLFWLGCAALLRRRLMTPLQTLANLAEAIRHGDYTLRGRRAPEGDVLGDVIRELNALGSVLQNQRLATMESGAFVQSILEELESAVFTFDGEDRLRLVNRAGVELLGRSAPAATGLTANELGLASLLGPIDGNVTAFSFPARSGRFEVHRSTFREAGLPQRLVVVSDLSRSLREEERRAWQRLIRVLGHEINNSLTPIKSLAQTVRDMLRRPEAAAVDPDIPASLDLIADRAESLTRFVAVYSQLARLPKPTLQPVQIRSLLERLVSLPDYRGVGLDADADVVLQADPGQLEQVLINLLKNALEATRQRREGVLIQLQRGPESLRLDVLDNGPGIANPDNLFVPFFTTKPGGSGIGLVLSRQIVDAHDGALLLMNRSDGPGCIARVVLPLQPRRGSQQIS